MLRREPEGSAGTVSAKLIVTLIVPMYPSVDTSNIHIGFVINLGYKL